jgi:hypothetical protein
MKRLATNYTITLFLPKIGKTKVQKKTHLLKFGDKGFNQNKNPYPRLIFIFLPAVDVSYNFLSCTV